MFPLRRNKQQYTHTDPIPFDETPTAPQHAIKNVTGSYPLSGFGFDLNTAARNVDLPADSWGVAVALTASVAAYRCNNVRSNLVGAMPWMLRKRGTEDAIAQSEDATPRHPFAAAVRRAEKNHGDTFFGLWEFGYGVHGEAYIEKIRNKFGYASDVYWLDPLFMTVFAPRGFITEYMYSGLEGTLRLRADQVTFDRYRHPYDHLRGLSPLEVALQGVNISRAVKQEILNFFKRAMRPGVLIAPGEGTQFDTGDVEFIRNYLLNNATGSANAYKPLIAPKDVTVTKFDPPSLVDQADLEERIEKSIHKAYGVSPAMTGDPDGTKYQSAEEEDEWLFKNTIQPECERIARVVNRDLLPFFDDGGELEFAFDYSGYSFVTEADEKRTGQIRADFESGLITYQQAREKRGEAPINLMTGRTVQPGEPVQDYLMLDGLLVPLSEVANVWKYKLLVAPSVYNSEVITGEPLPQPVDPNQVVPTDDGAVPLDEGTQPQGQLPAGQIEDPTKDVDLPSLCVMLDLANNPDLIALQKQVRSFVGSIPVEWNDPKTFHVTLAYVPNIEETKRQEVVEALQSLDMPELHLNVGSLKAFDSVGKYALHFRIRNNSDLLDFQESVYDLLTEHGLQLSSYSNPGLYTPHITMAYASQKPPTATFKTRLTVIPTCAVIADGDNELGRIGGDDENIVTIPASDVRRAVQTDALEELRAWYKVSQKSWSRPFENVHIDNDTAYLLRREIEASNGDSTAIGAAFKSWRRVLEARQGVTDFDSLDSDSLPIAVKSAMDSLIALDLPSDLITGAARDLYAGIVGMKSLTTTRARFESELERQMLRAFNEKVKKPAFIRNMLVLLTRYARQAYIDGYKDAGIDIDLDDPQDDEATAGTAWLSAFVDDQEQYVRGIADKLYADDAITEDDIRSSKPTLWFNGSVYPAYAQALTQAGDNLRLEWVYGDTIDHCTSCELLNGVVLTAKRWASEGVKPKMRELSCGGWQCDCDLKRTRKKKYRGKLPNWRKSVDLHDHDHE